MTNRRFHRPCSNSRLRRRAPDQWDMHQRFNMIGALEQQAEIALQLTMVSGEKDIRFIVPTSGCQIVGDQADGIVDQLVLGVNHGIDFADLIGGCFGRHVIRRHFEIEPGVALIPFQPVSRFVFKNLNTFFRRSGVPRRQWQISPIKPLRGGGGRVPRVMGVGKAHPAEPVVRIRQSAQPIHGPRRRPMSMIVLNGDRIVSNLRRAGVTPSGVRRRAADRIFMKPFDGIGVRVGQPFRIMEQRPPGAPCVTTQFHPLKAPVWSGRAIAGGGVFKISLGGMRLEMRLADQRRPVAIIGQQLRDVRCVLRQRNAVRRDPMAADRLAGQNSGTRWHADRALIAGLGVIQARGGQGVDIRGPGERAAIATQSIETLLVGGDQKYIARHGLILSGRAPGGCLYGGADHGN